MSTTRLLVQKNHLPTSRLQSAADAPLQDGEIRLRIDRFALTANNITYAAFGAAMNYWQFYPVAGDGAQDWGCIPVWGFAQVVQSRHAEVSLGERLYGYWPMASHAVLQPGKVGPAGFGDAAPHRAALHAVYNQYLRCGEDPFYTADSEDLQALLRPLYLTAWLIDDMLAADAPCVYVDFAGNSVLRLAIHRRFSALAYSCSIGGTHIAQLGAPGTARDLPGPRATLFFAPAQVKKRSADWGPAEFGRRLVSDWHAFGARVAQPGSVWLQVQQQRGDAAVQQAYADVLAGNGDPRVGHMLGFAPAAGGRPEG